MSTATETEIKLQVNGPQEIAGRLESAGFENTKPRVFEANTLYDTADNRLVRDGMLLRLRQAGDRAVITWKGRSIPGPHKARPELETSIGSAETLSAILVQLGYKSVFRYEKFRTEFKRSGEPGVIELDETPIGTFLELEGESHWIDRTAALLGFSSAQYILDSYGSLYRKFCDEHRVQPGNMVFASQ